MNDKFLQFLGLMKKAGKLAEGYNRCEDGFNKKEISLLILSQDLSLNTKEKFVKYCNKSNIPYLEAYSKEELGMVLGRPEINIVGVTDKKISRRLSELFEQINEA